MPKVAAELGALEVKNLTAPGFHPVGGVPGLALNVQPGGSRQWVLRVRVGGKRRDMGLGGFPAVTLAGARQAAREARQAIDRGTDPIAQRQAAQSALRAAVMSGRTFADCALAYIEANEAGWRNAKHGAQWRNTLDTYAFPIFGEMLARDVELPHVLRALEPIWTTKPETASRLRGRIETVLDWAAVRGLRPKGDNPARWRGHLDKLLPARSKVASVEHHRALPIDEVPGFVRRLAEAEGTGARALHFAILTAARSGEVRGATWDEIDLDAGLWTVPASRMKAKREHRVPLSRAALALLRSLPRLTDSLLVFPSQRGVALSDMSLLAVMRRMRVDAVPHGFRSSFRDWAAERTNHPRDVAEMALAHTIGDKVEAAYRRGDLFERRRRLMDDWAKFLSQAVGTEKVVALRRMRTS